MGWADAYIQKLANGETVKFRPQGRSMEPIIYSGDLVTVEPVVRYLNDIQAGDVVLCKVKGQDYLHLIKEVSGTSYLIGNNKGRLNGWIFIKDIYGVCTSV